MIKLETTRREHQVYDEGGYKFHVVTEYDWETGWSAGVSLSSFGLKDEGSALNALQDLCKKFQEAME